MRLLIDADLRNTRCGFDLQPVRRVAFVCFAFMNIGFGISSAIAGDAEAARRDMVEHQLKDRGIEDVRVLAAMSAVPREQFVPEAVRESAYEDRPLPIGFDQTISQPLIVASMTEHIHAKPTDRVLEIGTGSGYQAAVLSRLVAEVYTIEIVRPLAHRAEAELRGLGYNNVHVRAGDGYKGWPEHAPFDAIIVTAASDHVPEPLIAQLKDGGRIMIPVGEPGMQKLYVLEKYGGAMKQHAMMPVQFVPFTREP
jgi:protein-L-isoaspartate(D-aspartate) O-methyltransferase